MTKHARDESDLKIVHETKGRYVQASVWTEYERGGTGTGGKVYRTVWEITLTNDKGSPVNTIQSNRSYSGRLEGMRAMTDKLVSVLPQHIMAQTEGRISEAGGGMPLGQRLKQIDEALSGILHRLDSLPEPKPKPRKTGDNFRSLASNLAASGMTWTFPYVMSGIDLRDKPPSSLSDAMLAVWGYDLEKMDELTARRVAVFLRHSFLEFCRFYDLEFPLSDD